MKRNFAHLSQAIRHINLCNPARAKPLNLLENGSGSGRAIEEDFTGDSSKDIFAALLLGLEKILKLYTPKQRMAWKLRNMGGRDSQLCVIDISEKMHIPEKTLYRWLSQINEDLEREFQKRKILLEDED